MIVFHQVTYKNFLSSGDIPINVQLDANFSTLVVGSNGCGKSSFADAISFALFGKPHRNINKPQLVNSINLKNTLVTLEFSIASNRYTIVRGLKPGIFEIWMNGVMVNQDSTSRDYQKLLENNILKLNHKSFHQVVVLGSGNFTPFMQLPTGQRRSVIEDLLDIGIFTKMNYLLKEINSKLKDSIRDTDHRLLMIAEKIKLNRKHITELLSIESSNVAGKESEIAELKNKINDLVEKSQDFQRRYDEESHDLRTLLTNARVKKSNLESYDRKINEKISAIVKEAKFYDLNSSCPTCRQEINEEFRNDKLSSCKHTAQELSAGLDELAKAMSVIDIELSQVSDSLAASNKLMDYVRANVGTIQSYGDRISQLQDQLTQSSSSDTALAIRSAQGELTTLVSEKEALTDLKISQFDDRSYYEVISELLKDGGIKTKIIKQYLPIMNSLINNYLDILDFFVSFHLDESFNETIRSRHRDDFSYNSFSEGEKARINLAILFAWREVAVLRNTANTNLLILDETFDSSLDVDGVENLLKILYSLKAGSNVFVISHKQDLLDGKFDAKIEFEKYKNFSRIRK